MSTRAIVIASIVGVIGYMVIKRHGSAVGAVAVTALMEAIGYVESRGDYNAISPVNRNGERAYGKYQVLESNIAPWGREALARSVTVQEFLSSPDVQDAIVRAKIGAYLAQYGNAADVAAVWFSGRPLALAGNASDVTGVTVPDYVQKVLDRL